MSLLGTLGGFVGENPPPLTQFLWQSNVNQLQGTVDFGTDQRLYIKPTVDLPSNSMFGQWQLDSSSTFRTGEFATTRMGSPPASQQVEKFMANLFTNRQKIPFQMQPDPSDSDLATLFIANKDGSWVKFYGRMKPEVKWGEPIIEFFEIRPTIPSDRIETKFVIREINPNASAPLTKWRAYRDQINDLEVPADQKIMIRVKKFRVDNPEISFSQVPHLAYFLDLIYSVGPVD